MRRLFVGVLAAVAFAAILVAAFWGGPPAPPATKGPSPPAGGKAGDGPPKQPEEMLGIEREPGLEGEWHGARMAPEAKIELVKATESTEPPGRARAIAVANEGLKRLWDTKKAIVSVPPRIVAVEDDAAGEAGDLAVALQEFDAAFRERYKALFLAAPPPEAWVAPTVVLKSRDDYLRRTRPPIYSTGHTDLPSGWAYVPRSSSSDLRSGLFREAATQAWIGLALGRKASIPTGSLSAWFWTGTAAFWQAYRAEPDGRFTFGVVAGEWRDRAKQAWNEKRFRRLKDILAVRRRDLDSESDPLRIFTFGAQSYALVAYLESDPERRKQLDAFAEKELRGEGSLAAAQAAFGDIDELESKVEGFVRKLK